MEAIMTTHNIVERFNTIQSWVALAKLTFHWMEPPKNYMWAATETSFTQAISNKTRKGILEGHIPTPKAKQESNLATISHLKSNTTTKLPPTPPNILP
jgi:short subunit dehydrogenase-like uncharacterized protein